MPKRLVEVLVVKMPTVVQLQLKLIVVLFALVLSVVVMPAKAERLVMPLRILPAEIFRDSF